MLKKELTSIAILLDVNNVKQGGGMNAPIRSKGDSMSQILLFFVAGAACLFTAVIIYGKSEDTAFHKILGQYNKLVSDYDTVKRSNDELTKSNEELSSKIITFVGQVEAQSLKMEEVVKDCEAAQTHCAKLRESMIQLQDQVSKRRPVMKINGPIQLEIISNPKVNPKSPHLKVPIKKK